MKYLLFFGLIVLPVFGFSQVVDSLRVVREVDSLIQVSRALTGQRDFDKALEVNAAAEKIALEKFGRGSAAYGKCCFNQGRVFHFKGDYPEAEKWYLEAKTIREKVLGKDHLDYAGSLFNLAVLYYEIGKYEKAEPLYLEILAIREKVLGKEHPDYASSLYVLAGFYHGIGNFKKAEPLYLEVLTIREKVPGKDHPDYAWSLYSLARLYHKIGNYKKAEPLYLESIAIREKVLGKEHSDYMWSLSNLGSLYGNMGFYEKGEALYLEVLAIREKVLGKEHPDYAWSLNSLAMAYKEKGAYEKAEALFLEAKAIREKVVGQEHPDYAESLNDLANLYRLMGFYEKTEALYIESIAIRRKVLGKEDSAHTQSLNNLANLYVDNGTYEKAEALYLESIVIEEKVLGKEHPSYAERLHNLANLYLKLGNYEKAEALYLESIAIREKVLGKEHPDYAESLNNLAVLYMSMDNPEKAEVLFLDAKAIEEKVLGNEHPSYAESLNNLADLYSSLGNYEKAESLFLDAKAIQGKVLGKEHPSYANCLMGLADLHRKIGAYKKAELFFLEAKSILEKTLGKVHPHYALSLDHLANLYEFQNRFSNSEPLLDEYFIFSKTNLAKSAAFLSERELANYASTFRKNEDGLSACLISRQAKNEGLGILPALNYDQVLFQKGFLLNAVSRLNDLAKSTPESEETNNRLKGYRRRLAAEFSKPIAERKGVAALEATADSLEKVLVRSVAGYGEALRQVNWQEVQAALKTGIASDGKPMAAKEVAIEFIHFSVNFPKKTDSIMYAALVLLPGAAAPKFIPLFEERQLTPLLKGATGKAFSRINALYSAQAQQQEQKSLYDLVWKPLEQELQGVKTIYCSPSGLLHKVNLGAIPLQDGKFSDRYQVVVLGSTRKLVIPDNLARSGNEAQLFGGIHYTTDSTLLAAVHFESDGTRGLSSDALPFRTDSTTRGDSWNYLPETAVEVRDIQNILQSKNWASQLDTGYFATEEAFRRLGKGKPSPRLLHVATHGFFFPDPKTTGDERRRMTDDSEPVFRLSEHPLIRSGLILAGAQEAWSSGKPPENREDGILTAYEISQMNLSNTELVVLSACETGLGDIQGNEGVYGLQRAFKIAGAKYLIMSLWKVSDQSSREMMTEFYRQWLVKGLAIPEAFRKAQGNIKRKYPDAPYHWAGFVLVE